NRASESETTVTEQAEPVDVPAEPPVLGVSSMREAIELGLLDAKSLAPRPAPEPAPASADSDAARPASEEQVREASAGRSGWGKRRGRVSDEVRGLVAQPQPADIEDRVSER